MKKIFLAGMAVGFLSLGAAEGSKDGLIVGVDWSLGRGVGGAEGTSALTEDGKPDTNTEARGFYNNKTLTSNLKLVLGFQRYSTQNSALGFNIKAKFGLVGVGVMDSMMTHFESAHGDIPIPQGAEKVTSLQIPFTLGLEGNFLYDFFESGAHALGLSVGLGFEVVHSRTLQANIRDKPSLSDVFAEAFALNNMSYSLLSPKLGLHYFYGHHQFGIDMSFDKVLDRSFFGLQIETPIQNTILEQALNTKLNYFYTLALNYAYRF